MDLFKKSLHSYISTKIVILDNSERGPKVIFNYRGGHLKGADSNFYTFSFYISYAKCLSLYKNLIYSIYLFLFLFTPHCNMVQKLVLKSRKNIYEIKIGIAYIDQRL